ncbi:UDP-N-acetylglucosamine 2-epimerase [Actinobacillus delphinicola]|uniref:Nnaa n=1 Tax=Actinobacillus delphinicola TaxID=51161 RepID=A0A448TV67_9PAST|nr:UDP-N-acetylglucosamine 2-epimerase [Actinobacillus delphinicola]VEJ09831.1 nnaa [Actinobacillus delphinicola]
MKKILYVTGSRAEYGIVKRLLKKLQNDNSIDFRLAVTGMHLSEKYGSTYKVIEEDGIKIDYIIPITLENNNNQSIINSMAECLKKFGEHFQNYYYDAVIILGDRFEIFSVAIAAGIHNIPLIHLHGGEQTLGNYDEFIRHSITKIAKLHLTSTESYRKRVIQLGELPNSVINIGSLGAENGLLLNLPSKIELESIIGSIEKPYFLIVFHPETLNLLSVDNQIKELLSALDKFKTNYDFIFIGSNADTKSNIIFNLFREYTVENNFRFFTSLTPEEYLALIKYSCGIIGNSSSGLLEAPSFRVGTINIGDRQKGRIRGDSVINVTLDKQSIIDGIYKLISHEFQEILNKSINPYYKENSLEECYNAIIKFLYGLDINKNKSFYDM